MKQRYVRCGERITRPAPRRVPVSRDGAGRDGAGRDVILDASRPRYVERLLKDERERYALEDARSVSRDRLRRGLSRLRQVLLLLEQTPCGTEGRSGPAVQAVLQGLEHPESAELDVEAFLHLHQIRQLADGDAAPRTLARALAYARMLQQEGRSAEVSRVARAALVSVRRRGAPVLVMVGAGVDPRPHRMVAALDALAQEPCHGCR